MIAQMFHFVNPPILQAVHCQDHIGPGTAPVAAAEGGFTGRPVGDHQLEQHPPLDGQAERFGDRRRHGQARDPKPGVGVASGGYEVRDDALDGVCRAGFDKWPRAV